MKIYPAQTFDFIQALDIQFTVNFIDSDQNTGWLNIVAHPVSTDLFIEDRIASWRLGQVYIRKRETYLKWDCRVRTERKVRLYKQEHNYAKGYWTAVRFVNERIADLIAPQDMRQAIFKHNIAKRLFADVPKLITCMQVIGE